MMKPFHIALIGECMIELQELQPGKVHQTFGGDTLNTAIYMARLGRNLPVKVDYVTALGTDSFSEAMIAFWEKEAVGSSMVQRIAGKRPGLYYIQLDKSGERSFHYWRSEAAARQCFEFPESDLILSRLSHYDAVYLSGISLAILLPDSLQRLIARLTEIHAAGKAIYFDCNYRPHLWSSFDSAVETCKEIFGIAHTVLLNVEEGTTLTHQTTREGIHNALQAFGVRESVVRNGSNPCSVSIDGLSRSVPAKKISEVVDTTAAGDSFSAAYLLARKFGRAGDDAALFAHTVAAYVIEKKGAIAPMDHMPRLEI